MPKPRFCKRCGSVNIELIGDLIKCPDCGNLDVHNSHCRLGHSPETEETITISIFLVKKSQTPPDVTQKKIPKTYLN